jgi:hypothetical protein
MKRVTEVPRRILGFKHLKPDILPYFITGESIQLGAYSYYAQMEGARSDPTEGLFGKQFEGAMTPSMQQTLLDMNAMEFDPSFKVTFSNCLVASRAQDQPIFCASLKPNRGLCVREKLALVEIDIIPFATVIKEALPTLGGVRIGKVFYNKKEFELFHDHQETFDPCLKPPAFKWENEVRLIFGAPLNRPFIRLRVPEAAKN